MSATGVNQIIISTHSLTRRLTEAMKAKTEALEISTHSLTRRLTVVTSDPVSPFSISTHSLTRRLTTGYMVLQTDILFQLTASQGG